MSRPSQHSYAGTFTIVGYGFGPAQRLLWQMSPEQPAKIGFTSAAKLTVVLYGVQGADASPLLALLLQAPLPPVPVMAMVPPVPVVPPVPMVPPVPPAPPLDEGGNDGVDELLQLASTIAMSVQRRVQENDDK